MLRRVVARALGSSLAAFFVTVSYLVCVHGFVLLSSAARGQSRGGLLQGFEGPKPGEPSRVYRTRTELLLRGAVDRKSAGYQVHSPLHFGAVWEGAAGEKLLRFHLLSPKLFIKSRKAPTPEGFVEHSSSLDNALNDPFYALWQSGIIDKVYLNDREPLSLTNYKKGIISMFQFQVLDMEINETDVSHHCNVNYISLSPTAIRKIKNNCTMPFDTLSKTHPEGILSAITKSDRKTDYEMNADNTVLKLIINVEKHEMHMVAKGDAGNRINLLQHVELLENEKGDSFNLKAATLQQALQELMNQGGELKEQSLQPIKEPTKCQDDCPSLTKLIKDNKDILKSSQLGTIKSATLFIKLLKVVRESSANDILKALKSIKSKEILQQLCDLIGLAQTIPSHQAAKKFLHFDSEYDIDNTERYLWGLSMGSHPREEVIYDILKISENKNIPKKVYETLILTVSAMSYNFAQQSPFGFKHKAIIKVQNHVTFLLSNCKDSECRVMYIRALKNLKHPELIDAILSHAANGQKPVSVAAMKALKAMPKSYITSQVIKECQKIFYQIKKRYDSSSRTIAADIILSSKPSEQIVNELVWFLATDEPEYEIKQFLFQRLNMIADKCPKFRNMLMNIMKKDRNINNWHVMSQRGMTTAFTRPFMNTNWANGSLVSIQEISGGVLKRGHVDVLLESNGEQKELFSLGLFAGGLSNFMGSNNNNNDDGEPVEEESATAGMELTVQGVQIRPFTFFSGQGELMGHVWSGTASDRTTAFQALTLLQDHMEWIALGNGVTAEISVLGSASFDLAAQIQLSIWSRVAHSVVEKSAGIAIQGLLKADTSFVQSQTEFVIAAEPKLNLVSDIDFYTDIALCIQVAQPDTIVKHNIYKVERIPGSKHKLRQSKYKTVRVPGKTYVLNRKNNVMCNVIHNK